MKTAIVQDWLTEMGGSEKVVESMHTIFPSPMHVLAHNPKVFKGTFFEGKEIHTSFIQKLPFSRRKYRNYLPLFPLAIEQFDLSGYDVILSSSHAVAKGVLSHAQQLHICYCHSPMRYAWDLYHQYMKEAKLTRGLKGFIAKMVLHYLRTWDVSAAPRVDYFIANSAYVARRIQKVYNREAAVIYPPVEVDDFPLYEQKEDFYLAASRMVPYKRLPLIVEAFSKMPQRKLVVIGSGPDFKKVQSLAKGAKNIEVLGFQPFTVLKEKMQKARAFVFAAEEDFGITPVEAQACGTPVIAFAKGGSLETVKEGQTGLFFHEQSPQAIIQAIEAFEQQESQFSYTTIRAHAETFHRNIFEQKYKAFVEEKFKAFHQR